MAEDRPQSSKQTSQSIANLLNQARNCNVMQMSDEANVTDYLNDFFGEPDDENDEELGDPSTIYALAALMQDVRDEPGTPQPPVSDEDGSDADDYVPVTVDGHFRECQPIQTHEPRAENLLNEFEPLPPVPHCCCQYNGGKECYTFFPEKMLFSFRLSMLEKTKEELDLIVLSKLSAGMHLSDQTFRSRKKEQSPRSSQRTDFYFLGRRICTTIFRYLHCLGKWRLESLIKHFKESGIIIEARIHKKTKVLPHNAYSKEDYDRIKSFIKNYAERHAIPLPGRIPQFWRTDVLLLPTDCTKVRVYKAYEAALKDTEFKCVSLSTFKQAWLDFCPNITTMRPATDLCWVCQKNASAALRALEADADVRSAVSMATIKHIETFKLERSVYTAVCEETKRALLPTSALGEHLCNSWDSKMHYSFDFAQQIHYPSNPLQPGPIFFKTPRKCGLFGVCCEALSSQVNYLIDESVQAGKGSNCVVSLIHHFFENYGLGEMKVHLHADNCSGQNKNSCMMMYLLWRVLTGRHSEITLSFLIAGHTKFSCDWCFGLVKRRFKVTQVDCLADMERVVRDSAKGNIPQLCGNEKGEIFVPTYNWKDYLSKFFKKVVGIKKMHHFTFHKDSRGIVTLKETSESAETTQNLLIAQPPPDQLPPLVKPEGLSPQRQWYLYNEIREFASPEKQDLVAPMPSVPKPARGTTELEEEDEEPQASSSKAAKISPATETGTGHLTTTGETKQTTTGRGKGKGRGKGRGKGKAK